MVDPARPLVCFYGDDFTGSTDAAAQYRRFGLQTALLPSLPPAGELAGIARAVDVLGIAGVSRSLPTAELDREVRPVFEAFAALAPRFVQYKLCSTFDSAPQVGSFGRICAIAFDVFGPQGVPVLAAQPEFGRYTLFRNHFARAHDGRVYRLDRHPTMARHPVTPIDEADLVLHMERQWRDSAVRAVELPSLLQPRERAVQAYDAILAAGTGPVVFDAVEDAHLTTIGHLLWETRQGPVDFVMGSGGLSFAIASAHAERAGVSAPPPDGAWEPVDRMLAVSGSCAPGTGTQIEAALAAGWLGVRIDAARPDLAAVLQGVVDGLRQGRSVVVHSATGRPDRAGVDPAALGAALARVLRVALEQTDVRRVLVAGGDTSGYVVRALPVRGLEIEATPEVLLSLCRATADDPWLDGVEFVLKGGQVGRRDVLEQTRSGAFGASPRVRG